MKLRLFLILLCLLCLCSACNPSTQPLNTSLPFYDYNTAEDNLLTHSVEKDLIYAKGAINNGEDTKDLHIDVYTPVGIEDYKKAALLYIHGGGFISGNKNYMRLPADYFSSRGFVVFSMEYRLKDDNPPGELTDKGLPIHAAIVDAKAALRWIHANADTYNIDTNNIFISGSSAGAITALIAGITDEDLFVVDTVGGAIPASNSPGHPMDVRGIIDFCGGIFTYLDSLDSNDPPILIYHGTEDKQVHFERAEAIVKKAESVGLEYEFYPIEGAGHCPSAPAKNGKTLNQLSFEFMVKHMVIPE